jgi:adenosylhomocysteine nucleosidase
VRVAIFSAFPQEIKQIIKNLNAERSFERHPLTTFSARYSSKEIIIVLTGIGKANAERAVEYTVTKYSPDLALSIGFGGALYEGAVIGDVVWGSRVFLIQDDITETLDLPNLKDIVGRLPATFAVREGSILTLAKWMKKADIRKFLPAELSLPVCDMETFFLAKPAMEKRLPFFAIRSITDRAGEEIPREFMSVTDQHGNYKLSRALKLILGKPKLMGDIIRIGRNSSTASIHLWCAVRSIISPNISIQ